MRSIVSSMESLVSCWLTRWHDDDTRTRRDRQDRQPGRGAAARPRHQRAHRIAYQRGAIRLGRRHHLGAGARRRRLCVRVLLPGRLLPRCGRAGRGLRPDAVAHGARRLVMMSGRGEPEAGPAEDGVRGSGAEWTLLRCAWFAQNFSEHFLLQPVLDGVIALPAADVAEPFLDVDDVADVAVATLTRDGHAGRTYELTEPRLLTFADVAAELTRATGREIGSLPITAPQYAESAPPAGV